MTMKNRVIFLTVAALIVSFSHAHASQLTYLSCDIPSKDGPDRHFDFTLDEANGTVTFFVKDANATNVENAAFGPEEITWTKNTKYMNLKRSINRVDLSFTEESNIVGIVDKQIGTCQIKKPKERKF